LSLRSMCSSSAVDTQLIRPSKHSQAIPKMFSDPTQVDWWTKRRRGCGRGRSPAATVICGQALGGVALAVLLHLDQKLASPDLGTQVDANTVLSRFWRSAYPAFCKLPTRRNEVCRLRAAGCRQRRASFHTAMGCPTTINTKSRGGLSA
jgi:hypothetical protein